MKKLRWYEWVLGIISLILLVVLVQHSIATFQEGAGHAFWPMMLILGLPALILIAVVGQGVWRRHRAG